MNLFFYFFFIIFSLSSQAGEFDTRFKDGNAYNLRKDEIRNNIQKQPFIIDVVFEDEKSLGIGFFIKEDGTGLTSYHVVSKGKSFASIEGVVYPIEIIGFDEVLDVAIIKVKGFQSSAFNIAKNQEYLPATKVSILEKRTQTFGKILQNNQNSFIFDIDISVGFSGSPVFCGESVCGIITSFEKQTNHAIATKTSKITKNFTEMLAGNNFKKKQFNFYVMDLQKYDSLSQDFENPKKNLGVLITYSDEENLQTWDIITQVNGQDVNNVQEMQGIISRIYANEETVFTVIRGKQTIVISIP